MKKVTVTLIISFFLTIICFLLYSRVPYRIPEKVKIKELPFLLNTNFDYLWYYINKKSTGTTTKTKKMWARYVKTEQGYELEDDDVQGQLFELADEKLSRYQSHPLRYRTMKGHLYIESPYNLSIGDSLIESYTGEGYPLTIKRNSPQIRIQEPSGNQEYYIEVDTDILTLKGNNNKINIDEGSSQIKLETSQTTYEFENHNLDITNDGGQTINIWDSNNTTEPLFKITTPAWYPTEGNGNPKATVFEGKESRIQFKNYLAITNNLPDPSGENDEYIVYIGGDGFSAYLGYINADDKFYVYTDGSSKISGSLGLGKKPSSKFDFVKSTIKEPYNAYGIANYLVTFSTWSGEGASSKNWYSGDNRNLYLLVNPYYNIGIGGEGSKYFDRRWYGNKQPAARIHIFTDKAHTQYNWQNAFRIEGSSNSIMLGWGTNGHSYLRGIEGAHSNIYIQDKASLGSVAIGTNTIQGKVNIIGDTYINGVLISTYGVISGTATFSQNSDKLDDYDSSDFLFLNQSSTQTIISGIPLLNNTPFGNADLKSFVNKEYVDLAVTSAVTSLGASYYMYDEDDATGYKTCYLNPSTGTETYIEKASLTDNDYIGGWISAGDEAPQKLLKGVYNWYLTAEKTTGTQDLRIYWVLVERKSDTTEVVISTSSNSNLITDKEAYLIPLQLDEDYIPDTGSRIVGKLYADVSGNGNAPTIRVYYQGNTSSRWEIPANSEIFQNIFVPYENAKKDIDLNERQITNVSTITFADGTFMTSTSTFGGAGEETDPIFTSSAPITYLFKNEKANDSDKLNGRNYDAFVDTYTFQEIGGEKVFNAITMNGELQGDGNLLEDFSISALKLVDVLDANGFKIINHSTSPTSNSDVSTKGYTDYAIRQATVSLISTDGLSANWDAGDYQIHISTIRADGSKGLYLLDDGGNGIYVEDGGEVGIGTTNPNELLVVGDDIGYVTGNNAIVIGQSGNTRPVLIIGNDSNNYGIIGFNKALDNTNPPLVFTTKESGNFYENTLVIKTGNVGIGDTSPSYKLDVTGDIHCTGKLTSDGGNDPPYVLYNYETRQSIIERVKKEVTPDKLNGAVMFYNGEANRMTG